MNPPHDFHGLPTRSLANAWLRVEYLAEAGPRIVRVYLGDDERNQLVELPALSWTTPYGDYFIRGGHRLWHAPEGFPRSYVPDNAGLQIVETEDGVQLEHFEAPTGLRKSIALTLAADRPTLTLVHTIRNDGLWPVELAPWAITQVPLGGVVILPLAVPEETANPLLPNRQLVAWPYTRWTDPRLSLYDDVALMRGESALPPCKIGYFNYVGWLGYAREGVLFRKRFTPLPEQPHTDRGCNVECFVNDLFLEIETLGPYARLDPGQSCTHTEVWEFERGIPAISTIEDVRALLKRLDS